MSLSRRSTTNPSTTNGGLGFHSIDAPLGGRYWFAEQKIGVDFGFGIRSTPAPSYDEDLSRWAVELGVPFVVKSWDKVHVLLRPGFLYDSQEVEMSDPPEPFATDDETTIALTAELEVEVFIVNNFSVSASHGIGYFKVEPAGGWSTFALIFRTSDFTITSSEAATRTIRRRWRAVGHTWHVADRALAHHLSEIEDMK